MYMNQKLRWNGKDHDIVWSKFWSIVLFSEWSENVKIVSLSALWLFSFCCKLFFSLELSVKFPATKGICSEESLLSSSRKPCVILVVFVSVMRTTLLLHLDLVCSFLLLAFGDAMTIQFGRNCQEKISEVSIHLAKSCPIHRRTAFYCQEKHKHWCRRWWTSHKFSSHNSRNFMKSPNAMCCFYWLH